MPNVVLRRRTMSGRKILTMDSYSITTDCIEVGNTIGRASLVLNNYVRDVREARADLDVVSRELHSLQSVLNLLKGDAGALPSKVATETSPLLKQCNQVVSELDADLLALDGSALTKVQKRAQWISVGKHQISELLPVVEVHRAILALALDLIAVYVHLGGGRALPPDQTFAVPSNAPSSTHGRELHDSTEQGEDDQAENAIRQAEVRNGTMRVVDDMSRMRERWADEFDASGPYFHLSTYYVALKLYASSLLNNKDGEGAYLGEGMFGAYMGDSPDSAIEVNEVNNEVNNEVSENVSFQSIETPPEIESPALTLPEISPISPIASQYLEDVSELMEEMIDVPSRPPTPPPKDLKRLVAMRSSMVSPFDPPVTAPMEMYGVVTHITAGNKRPNSARRPPSRSGTFGRWLEHIKNVVAEAPSTVSGRTMTSSSSSSDTRPMTPIIQASLVRRGSRRLSTSIKRLPLWSTELDEPEGPATPGSNAVFGVSLAKSMQAAKSSAKTHHTGSGSSRREFPLCVHKCVHFLQLEGLEAPHIFSEPGDGFRVQKLKEAFSAAPKYGENLDWNNYGVYDAADIILIFLSQLPKPLITEVIAKRWISLSKQATLSGSHGTRLDQCIDFWEETLLGLRGAARSLFKLLLNLWSSIADCAEQNEMTAERLASVILKPLMHTSSPKYSTDYMLSLAFLIRKRSEYLAMMRNDGRESRAAW